MEKLRANLVSSVSNLVKTVKINSALKPKKWFDQELRELRNEKIEKYHSYVTNRAAESKNEKTNTFSPEIITIKKLNQKRVSIHVMES